MNIFYKQQKRSFYHIASGLKWIPLSGGELILFDGAVPSVPQNCNLFTLINAFNKIFDEDRSNPEELRLPVTLQFLSSIPTRG